MGVGNRAATNQPPPLVGYDVVGSDLCLTETLARFADEANQGGPSLVESLEDLGRLAGSAEAREHAMAANRHTPELVSFDRFGNRLDEVRFHPSWHWLMEHALSFGLAATPWTDERADAHVRRAAGFFAWSQVENGHGCPVSMTYAAVPALRADLGLAATWEARLVSTTYDFGLRPPGSKAGCLAGMGMTEKQGGSDVRANVTTAAPDPEGGYRLDGHKWFTSAPMNDVFLVLAQAPGGLSCFVIPRVLESGDRNPLAIQRLKDKLGNRSNASAEIEFDQTWGELLGDEGRGVRTIIEMVAATRLDCVIGSAALMRRAVSEASWHVGHRRAFGARLADQPLMQNVIADLAVESEAATVTALRLAHAVDHPDDLHEVALRRIALPLAKFWVCKRTPTVVAEALECLGGNGYVEESGMPMLFRESPLNSIWEGSGNINALDVLRALRSSPEVLDAWLTEVGRVAGENDQLDRAVHEVLTRLADLSDADGSARRLAAMMACCLQAALLVGGGSAEVADVFCASRLGGDWSGVFGTLPAGPEIAAVTARTTPVVE
jgi:putative acyl-CoA dehydrogenase